ncbi:MAG: tRNA lysidine(34) synthetase TilS [Patescibacteria group bacterium]|nr:tRNA lysidine(34) synthetase TilS [Patescibacteria group bacterium]
MSGMHPFEHRLSQAWPSARWRDLTVLVAVSGGPDSVALLRALAALQRPADGAGADASVGVGVVGSLQVAHLNHHLRGDDSDADEQFVVQLCCELGLRCHVGHAKRADVVSRTGTALEATSRRARHRFLRQLAGTCGARYVALAHTADDQAETILHRIVRGTGLAGLGGMTRARPLGHAVLIRPLLGFRRAELLEYLADVRQPYRIDRSNADPRFTRNRIRNDLLPRLAREYNPKVTEALLRLGTLADEVCAWTSQQVEPLHAACRELHLDGAEGAHVDSRRLRAEPTVLVRELLMAVWQRRNWPMGQMGFDQWERLAQMVRQSGEPASERQNHTFPGGILAESGPDGLALRPPR